MSDSTRKNLVLKDTGYLKKLYWRIIRRVWKNKISNTITNGDITELELPNNNTIVGKYEYHDWIYRCDKDADWQSCSWCKDNGFCKIKNKK